MLDDLRRGEVPAGAAETTALQERAEPLAAGLRRVCMKAGVVVGERFTPGRQGWFAPKRAFTEGDNDTGVFIRERFMKYEVAYDAERDVIAGQVFGDLGPAEVREMAAEFARLARTQGCRKLVNDLRDAGTSSSALHIHTMPRMVHEQRGLMPCLRALVVPQDSEALSFLESVAQTIGETVGIFTDRESAMEWLTKGRKSAPASGKKQE